MTTRRQLVMLLAAVTAIGPFAMQALAPALPAIADGFGVSAAASQLMLSLSLVAMALATLVWGPVSDRVGRRPALIAGLCLAVLGSFTAMLAPSLGLAVTGRILQAAGAVAGMVLARAVAQDRFGREGAAGALGQITAAMVLAPMLAPALSGVMVEALGWRSIFGLVGLAGIGLVLCTVLGLEETAPLADRAPAGGFLAGYGDVAARRAFWAHVGFGAFSFASFLFFVGAAPYVMVEAYGRGPSVYGLYFIAIAAAYMAANLACGGLTRRFGGQRMLRVGGGLGLAGAFIGVMLLLAGVHHPLVLFLPAGLQSVGAGLSVPNALAGAVAAAPGRAGVASGLMGFAQFIAGGAAAQFAGSLPHDSALGVIAGTGVLLAAAIGINLILHPSHQATGSG